MTKGIFPFIFLALTGSLFLVGCSGKKQTIPICEAQQAKTLTLDTIAYIHPTDNFPSCKVTLKLPFLQATDSASVLVNQSIIKNAFGPAYTRLSPERFIKTYSEALISQHKADIAAFLEEDLKRGIQPAAWYNYEFDLEANLRPGLGDSIWNYTLTDFRQTGGAHPNTIKTCLNIKANTGCVLAKKDVFKPNADQALTPLIIKSLSDYLCRKKIRTPNTLEGLQEAGLFLNTTPYIPENFLIRKNSVTFYYNRYEIADYATGDFEITIPLSDIKDYLII